ncbi:MAG: tetratricopeptide repeat protein [Ignavibacteriae bacterium]|nr:tetratricopeptide repeat protein [Ignavibacteriota bacterium]
MINFRYDIRKTLGQGGSGEVFLAEDLLSARRECAIKVMHAESQAGEEAAAAFRNEISSLLKLEHPNLVRIFDFGVILSAAETPLQGRRFVAMEYLHGADSLEWLSKVPASDSRDQLLEVILLQALSALSHVHREGIIHFDVKPQNLVLLGDVSATSIPVLKLMDFGFSSKQEGTAGLSIRGTLEYTAPELLRGESYDHRIDLYSLGATFYHLLTGRCPFEAANPVDLVKLALNEEPAFSSGARTKCHDVVARLLQKTPDKRFRDAEEVARFLVEGKPNANELLESYFGRTRKSKFVGRKPERHRLESALHAIATGQSSAPKGFVISGGEGIGKSALVVEMSKYARAQGLTVAAVENVSTAIPFDGIFPVINQLCSVARSYSSGGEAIFQKYADVLAHSRDKPHVLREWTKESEKSVELLARFLVECSSVFPVVIIADDCHLLDTQSLGVLQAVVRDMTPGRGLVLAAETTEIDSVASLVVEELRLHDLAPEEVRDMSTSIFGSSEFSNDIGASIYRLYGGTPGVLAEAFSAARDVVADTRSATTPPDLAANFETLLPRTLDDFLLRRFRKLNSERQLILSVVSCFLNPAPIGIVASVLPFHPRRFADQLRYLQLEGFVSASESDALLLIRMKRLKDAIYNSIAPQHVELHALIADALEQKVSGGNFLQLQELAFQFSNSNQQKQAGTYFEKSGWEGLQLFAFEKALEYLRAAERIAHELGDADWEASLRLKLLVALFRSGAYNEVIRSAEELKSHPSLSAQGRFLLFKKLGLSLSRLGEVDAAQKNIQTALLLTDDDIERLELKQELVGTKIATGAFQEAEKECAEQLEAATTLQQDRIIASIYTDLGISTFYQDRFAYAAECFMQSLQKYESLNERTQVINSMNNISNALSAGGEYDRAIEFLEKALAASKEQGTLMQQGQVLNNLGIAHFKLKKFARAKELYGEARAIYERAGSRPGIGGALINLGEVQSADGEYEQSIGNLRATYKIFAQLEDTYAMVDACLHLTRVFVLVGNLQAAEKSLEEARALVEKHEFTSFRSDCSYLHGLCLLMKNAHADAEKAFSAAIELTPDPKTGEAVQMAYLKLAECKHLLGQQADAVEIVLTVLREHNGSTSHRIVAEGNYLLALIAMHAPDATPEKPLVTLKRGLEAIAKEPISEITWKLAFALAREYYERGQRERAKEFLLKTKLVLQFFLSRFRSNELKDLYLDADHKRDVIATIESLTKQ